MHGTTSFYHAIFKRLQTVYHWESAVPFDGHLSKDDNAPGLYGGFSLKYPSDKYGMFGSLSAAAGAPVSAGLKPLVLGNNVPAQNPLYVMLAAAAGPIGSIPDTVTVGTQKWPVMPPPDQGTLYNTAWLNFNAGTPPPLVDAFGAWITAGKPNDEPQGPLLYPARTASPLPAFPGATGPILFVASFAGDDGRRPGDMAMPAVPVGHVPGNYWDTSQIFLTDAGGAIVTPLHLAAGAEYYVQAVIGQCGPGIAGGLFNAAMPLDVQCDAQCFNTGFSPGVQLPSLGNLDPTDPNPLYEQFYMDPLTTEVAGFRFNVDAVFAGLVAALTASNMNLGGLTPTDWLKDGHPCVKVRLMSGEYPNGFTPQGPVPGLGSNPQLDRHIAQHNLVPFDTAVMARTPIHWTNFIVPQVGDGANALTLQHGQLPADVRFTVAMPSAVYKRYVAGDGGGSARGFDLVTEGIAKPFPDAVMLRQTSPEARLVLAPHRDERYLGLGLGIETQPGRGAALPWGDIRMVHVAHDGHVVGGFTLRPLRR